MLHNRWCWALFSMREEHVASLDAYLRPIPTRLNTRFRLDLLEEESARQAIEKPAEDARVHFTSAAAAKLINNLRRVWVQRPDGTRDEHLGPYIEPVQLQVVCYRLWERLRDDEREIREEDVEALGDVDKALSDYYANRVAAVARETGVREFAIREGIMRLRSILLSSARMEEF